MNLAAATTQELLDEIKLRGERETHYRVLGDEVSMGASALMEVLPGSMLSAVRDD